MTNQKERPSIGGPFCVGAPGRIHSPTSSAHPCGAHFVRPNRLRRFVEPQPCGLQRFENLREAQNENAPIKGAFSFCGAPGRIRTSDRLVRSQVLYPAELRAHCLIVWRRERDSNPRRAINPYSLSRGALSTTQPSLRLHSCQFRDTPIDVVGRGIAAILFKLLKVGPPRPRSFHYSIPADRESALTRGFAPRPAGALRASVGTLRVPRIDHSAISPYYFSYFVRRNR